MDYASCNSTSDTENFWPDLVVEDKSNCEGRANMDVIGGGSDNWIDDVDVSRFASEINPELRNYSRNATSSKAKFLGEHPKPTWSYSCLIALALKNCASGRMTVAEIYAFMCDHFPYFRTAPSGWKNSVRHNLSLNKCFEKIEVENDAQGRKSCLWSIRAEKMDKMEMDIQKSQERDINALVADRIHPQRIGDQQEGGTLGTSAASVVQPKPQVEMRFPVQYVVKTEPIEDVKPPPSNPRINLPAILNRYAPKRVSSASKAGSSDRSSSHPSSSHSSSPPRPSLVPIPPIRPHTPVKKSRVDPGYSSPISLTFLSDYDTASAALTDNSLLVTALGQSPYRGPTTFPTLSR